MKNLKIFLIALFIISFSNLYAQEKQNDATWEETIEFINKNKMHIIADCCAGPLEKTKKFNITDNIVTFSYASSSSSDNIKSDLTFLKESELSHISNYDGKYWHLKLIFIDEVVLHDDYSMSFFGMLFSSELMGKKFDKAFKQLAYLAKEKRKQSKF